MSLRSEIIGAYEATQAARVDTATALLAAAPWSITTALHTVDTDQPDGDAYTRVVFTDADSSTYLAVVVPASGAPSVHLVTPDGAGGWTDLGVFADPASLGKVLPGLVPPPAWVQPTGAQDAYATGERVTYEGAVYESLIDGNTTVPGSDPRWWEKVGA